MNDAARLAVDRSQERRLHDQAGRRAKPELELEPEQELALRERLTW